MDKQDDPQETGQDILHTMNDMLDETEAVAEEVEAETVEVTEEPIEEVEAETVEELPPLEPNALWDQDTKERFGSLDRETQQFLIDTTTNWQTGYNEKFQALAEERRNFEAVEQSFSADPIKNYLNLNGWSVPQAAQIMSQHIMNILADPKTGSETFLKAFGQDPYQLFAPSDEDNYVDPNLSAANQQIAEIQQERAREKQQQISAMNQQIMQDISNFANEKTEQGNLKHPRFEELRQLMSQLTAGKNPIASNIEQAYQMAEQMNPIAQDPAKVTQEAASPEAVTRARIASKKVKSKQSVKPKNPATDKTKDVTDYMQSLYDSG